VASRYGEIARSVRQGQRGSCASTSGGCCGSTAVDKDIISSDLYLGSEKELVPAEAVLASLGCGNPTALATLSPGETVLDLGSGGGIDVFLSARRVGPTGRVYGLDMTDDMLALAEENRKKTGLENVTFLKGQIEDIPLPDESVDVIISNCVINLSTDKNRVLSEAFRVLRPGGRFAVSDIVVQGEMSDSIRRDMELWTGCVAGALSVTEFEALLSRTGFIDTGIEPTRVFDQSETAALLEGSLAAGDAAAEDARIVSAFIRGTKPSRNGN
jgi:arsenite methyltransferase